jgi:hypothetical protein
MRYYNLLPLAAIVLILDALIFGLGFFNPYGYMQPSAPAVALAAPQSTPRSSMRPAPATATAQPTATPSATPSPTSLPPTATPSPSPTATATPEPPPRVLAEHAVSFTPVDRAVRANIHLALSYYQGALNHVFVGPGAVFSFNAALGLTPQRLPWKYVVLKPTAAAPPVPGPDGTPAPAPSAQEIQRIQGGGLCDLASRYVMAARPLLPARAFRFVNHVRSNGIHLRGVPERDSVSIWAVGGQSGEQDLRITNVTGGWLEFVIERDGEKITVRARLWDRLPPA